MCPVVEGVEYPYTKKGIKRAKKASRKTGKKMKKTGKVDHSSGWM